MSCLYFKLGTYRAILAPAGKLFPWGESGSLNSPVFLGIQIGMTLLVMTTQIQNTRAASRYAACFLRLDTRHGLCHTPSVKSTPKSELKSRTVSISPPRTQTSHDCRHDSRIAIFPVKLPVTLAVRLTHYSWYPSLSPGIPEPGKGGAGVELSRRKDRQHFFLSYVFSGIFSQM